MNPFWIGVFVGLLIGCCLGIIITSLLTMGSNNSYREEFWKGKEGQENHHV